MNDEVSTEHPAEPEKRGIRPPPRRRSLLEARERVAEQPAPDHLATPTDGGYRNFVDLGFKVEPWFKRRYAIEAAFRGLSKKDLMLACFQAFLDANGGTMEKAKADSMVGD
jgi:hypothetical protein